MHIPDINTDAGEPLDVLVVGEALIDMISVEEADSLFEAQRFEKFQGGSPANIAVNVAKLQGTSAIIAKTGIGAFGQFIKAELRRAGVVTDYLAMDHRVHTTVIFVSRTSGTPDFEAFRDGDYQLAPRDVDEEAIKRAKVIHASTFALSREPCRSAIRRAFALAKDHDKIISLDPNYSNQIWPDYREALEVVQTMLGYATITKPSLDDAQRLFGEGLAPEAYIDRFHELGPSTVVFTMGAQGVLLSVAGERTHIPAQPVEVVDATGAGDAFWAGFLVALLDGHELETCARFAREVVGRKLTTVGPLPDMLDRAEIYARIED
jgi:fructokinase